MAGMVGGQMADMEAEGKPVELPALQYIHVHKTGKLLQAALVIGAWLSGAAPPKVKALARYGESLGLAFQITDDILDVVGNQGKMGKNTGGDQVAGKATYPSFFGLEESRRQASDLCACACRAITPLGPAAAPLRALAGFIVEREV